MAQRVPDTTTRTRPWIALLRLPGKAGAFLYQYRHALVVDLFVGAIFTVVVGGAFVWWQESREDARMAFQEDQERQRSDRAEMIANLVYIRETLRDGGPKQFRGLNLRGADLSNLDFGCDQIVDVNAGQRPTDSLRDPLIPADESTDCADFTGSDLKGAVIDGADFTGAQMEDVNFQPKSARATTMFGATVTGTVRASIYEGDLRGARFTDAPDQTMRLKVSGSVATMVTVSAVHTDGSVVQFERTDVTGAAIWGWAPSTEIELGSGCERDGLACEWPDWLGVPPHVHRQVSSDLDDLVAGQPPQTCYYSVCEPDRVPHISHAVSLTPGASRMAELRRSVAALYPPAATAKNLDLRFGLSMTCRMYRTNGEAGAQGIALVFIMKPPEAPIDPEPNANFFLHAYDAASSQDHQVVRSIVDIVKAEPWCAGATPTPSSLVPR